MAVYVLISEPFAGCIVWENQRRAWACFCDLHAVTELLPEYHWALLVFMMENSGPNVFGGGEGSQLQLKLTPDAVPLVSVLLKKHIL